MTFPAQQAASSRPRALLIEDDPSIQGDVSSLLEAHGYAVEAQPNVTAASRQFSVPHLIFMKVASGDEAPPQFAEWARRKSGRQQPYILAMGQIQIIRGSPNAAMLWNDVVPWDADARAIESRFAAANQWLSRNHPGFAAPQPAESNQFLEQTGLKRATAATPAPAASIPAVAQPAGQPGVVASPFRAAGPPRNRPATIRPVETVAAQATAAIPTLAAAGGNHQEILHHQPMAVDDTFEVQQRSKLPQARPAGIEIRPTSATVARPAVPPSTILHPGRTNDSARMRQLLDHLPMAVALFDRSMRYLAANKRWLDDFNLTEAETLGRSHYDVFPDLHENWKRVYQLALAGETQRSDERVVDHPDGSCSWVRWEVTPWIENENEAAAGILISCQKMTSEKGELAVKPTSKSAPLKSARPPLAASPKPPPVAFIDVAEKMLATVDSPAMALDLKGEVVYANRHLSNVLGSDKLKGNKLWDIAAGDQKQPLHDACDSIAAHFEENGKLSVGSHLDFILFNESGEKYRLAWSAAPRRDAEDAVVGIALFGTLRKEDRAIDPIPLEEKISALESELTSLHEEKLAADAAQADAKSLVHELESKLASTRASLLAAERSNTTASDYDSLPADIIGQVPGGIAVLDRDATTLYANDGFTQLLGFSLDHCGSVEKWLQRGSPDASHSEEVVTTWWERVWQAHATKVFSLSDSSHVLRDIELRPKALSDDRVLILASDVTDKRRAEDALRTSEARFRTLFRECGVGVSVVDRSGAILNVNPYLERMLGTNLTELRRRKFESLLPSSDIAAKRELETSLQGGDPNEAGEVDLHIQDKDGELIPVTLRAALVRNQAGKELFTAFFIRERTPAAVEPSEQDVSAPAEAPLDPLAPIAPIGQADDAAEESPVSSDDQQSKKIMAALLEATPLPVLIADCEGTVTECNRAAEEFLATGTDALDGQSLALLFDEMDVDAFQASLIPTLKESGSFHGNVTIVRATGTEECGLQLFGINDATGELASIVAAIEPHPSTDAEPAATESFDTEPPAATATPAAADNKTRDCLHQIKNHLQILMSLQNLQMKKPSDPAAESAVLATRNRLNAVAHVYQNVGVVENEASTIPFHRAAEALLQSLQRGWQTSRSGVKLSWRLDDLNLHTTQAVPLALVVNELVSNAFEHGFPAGASGTIKVRLGVKPKRKLAVLIITNSGVALSDSPDNPDGQGLAIAETLTDQIGGSFRVCPEGKPEFRIVFPLFESDLPS